MRYPTYLLAGFILGLASASHAAFTCRLWFENHTTGAAGTGAIAASPGDEIWISYSFHGDTVRPNKWTLLQMFADLSNTTVLSDADCNTWDAAMRAAWTPSTTYSPVTPWQCSDGAVYDNATDPSDSTQPLVTTKGIYLLVGVFGSKVQAQNVDKLAFFKFHVSASALVGDKLDWGYVNRNTGNGIATMMWDNNNVHHQVTDNWVVVVVPEPRTVAALAFGVLWLLAVYRRK